MGWPERFRKLFSVLIDLNYYVAALLLLVAGGLKFFEPGVGELLNTLYERELLSFGKILIISRVQPWLEVGLGIFALSGWRNLWAARILASVYLFFALLVLYVSDGYLLLPIDCGCFGEGHESPVYLILLRNGGLALLLLFYGRAGKRQVDHV